MKVTKAKGHDLLSCLSLIPFAPSEGFAYGESDFVAELYAYA